MNSIPDKGIYARRRRKAFVILCLFTVPLIPPLALIVPGIFVMESAVFGIYVGVVGLAGLYGYIFLPLAFGILLLGKVQNPIHFGIAGIVALGVVYLLWAETYSILEAMIALTLGGATGFVFWAAVRKRIAPG